MGWRSSAIDEAMSDVEERYRAGEMSRNRYLLETGRLRDRVDAEETARVRWSSPAFTWGLVALLLAAAFVSWWVLRPLGVAWAVALAGVAGALWVALTPRPLARRH